MIELSIFLFLIASIVLFANLIDSVENFKSNSILGKQYRKQQYKKSDLNKCPKCGHPYLWSRIIKEGWWEGFIPNKYYRDKFECFNEKCGFTTEVILRWDNKEWSFK